jgi:hypothetical protein
MKRRYQVAYSKFENEEQMLDFINQYNENVVALQKVTLKQEEMIDVLRENIRDLIKVVNTQEQSIDLTDRLMEHDFAQFQDLLVEE